jgi:hypothetical protein
VITGKPVITSPLPEAIRLAAYLTLAASDAFPQAVAAALATLKSGDEAYPNDARTRLDDFLQSESWEAKADRFLADVMDDL